MRPTVISPRARCANDRPRSTIRRAAGAAAIAAVLTTPVVGQDAAVERDVARVRAATEKFKSLDQAVAAGYGRDGGRCLDNPPHGAMGFHHQNDALLDDRLEVERPEMLVYERLPNGQYRLNGVEYIVPFSARPETSPPPTVMGQALKPAPSLKIWYLHVWVFTENPSGLFADWNPRVTCGGDARP
jgi:hypothetical protein